MESAHAGRTRYLVVVCRHDEAALLGIDCNEGTTVGLVLRVLADTSIKLDGDGQVFSTNFYRYTYNLYAFFIVEHSSYILDRNGIFANRYVVNYIKEFNLLEFRY